MLKHKPIPFNVASMDDYCVATAVANLWIGWDSDRTQWRKEREEVLAYIYATSTETTTNKNNEWNHTTHIPKLTQIYDNLGANYHSALFSNRDFFTFDPSEKPNDKTDLRRKAIVSYLKAKNEASGFRAVMKELADDYVRDGNPFARTRYIREKEKDDVTGETYVTFEGPVVERISPVDIVFNYKAPHFEQAAKVVRSYVNRHTLRHEIYEDPKGLDFNGPGAQKFLEAYSAGKSYQGYDQLDEKRRRFDGFSNFESYLGSGMCEVLEISGAMCVEENGQYFENVHIAVVDRLFVVRIAEGRDIKDVGPIRKAGWRKRDANLWSQSPLANLIGMQYIIDHLENAKADGFDQILNADRVIVGQVRIESDGRTRTYYVDDAQGDVRNLAPDSTVLNADFQIERKEMQMEMYAGAPREAMGIRSPGEKTAFEYRELQNAASRMFQAKAEDFEEEIVEPVLNDMVYLAKVNLNATDLVKVVDNDLAVKEFVEITREDLRIRGEIKARGAAHYARRAQLVQELQQFEGVLAAAPDMKIHYPGLKRAQAWNAALNFRDFDLYVPYGAVNEQLEAGKRATLAQNEGDKFTAAATMAEDESIPDEAEADNVGNVA